MRALLLSIKNTALPLSSSLVLHAAVLAGLIGAWEGGLRPGPAGGSQQIYDVSFEGTGEGIAELHAVPSGHVATSALRSPEMLKAADELRIPAWQVKAQKIPARKIEAPPVSRGDSAHEAEAPAAGAAQPVGSFGSGGGSGGGAGRGNGGADGEGAAIAGFVRAVPLDAPRPDYPEGARQSGFSGKVVLNAAINEEGQVREAAVLQSSGRTDCDTAALATLRERWRFMPASLHGMPVQSNEKIVVVYRLAR